LTSKAKQFDVWRDDIEGERWRRGRLSRHFLAFNVIIILLADDIWCFHRVPLLSRESSHLGWIALSFKII
jgi:hypothetical protein